MEYLFRSGSAWTKENKLVTGIAINTIVTDVEIKKFSGYTTSMVFFTIKETGQRLYVYSGECFYENTPENLEIISEYEKYYELYRQSFAKIKTLIK